MKIITVLIVFMRLQQVNDVPMKPSVQIAKGVSTTVPIVRKAIVSTMLFVLLLMVVLNAYCTVGAVMEIMATAMVRFVLIAKGVVRLAMITDHAFAARICYAHATRVTETRAAVTIRTAMKIAIAAL